MANSESIAAPSGSRLNGEVYRKELRRLQADLCLMQESVKKNRLRIIIIFEGRDASGKGGTIRAITERVSPRIFRVVALPAPSDREKSRFFRRYLRHVPAAGEIVIFDRSWYNRAGVECVMGFCTKEEHGRFLRQIPIGERFMTESGIILIKFWLEVSYEEQQRRFQARIEEPLRQWKLSPIDLASRKRWYEYSRARDTMFTITDTPEAPWYILRSDDKRRARLNCISHLLSLIPWEPVQREKVMVPARSRKGAYDDQASLTKRSFVPEKY